MDKFGKDVINDDRLEILREKINNMIKQIDEYKDLPKILIIGHIGSGKSALASLLANQKLIIDIDEGEPFLRSHSQKDEPSMLVDPQRRFVLCDCSICDYDDVLVPIENEIIDSIFIKYLIKNENQLKILIVITESEIESFHTNPIVRIRCCY